ncbi:MAG: DNA-binding response regulator [Firmicutes bacterium HGW-Firmicutes-1]|jgi:DNA-binding response OmpR family regulator|nr:MAG: DNA-binding response regulator [Firmicutes bacterium HGW-Firmicutes-1]
MSNKILIIEDEVSIGELEKDYLEINGFEVNLITNGKKGLMEARTNHYDLIILDLMLPEIDGFEICKKVREKSNIPILMVSARKEDIDKIRGLGLGADDYMTKPFSPNELVARVKAHILRYERLVGINQEKNELSIRGLTINLGTRRVSLNGQNIFLTAKEFDLLLYLAQNPDIVLSKDLIFDRVWGMDSFGDIATVTVHIGKIREKIEKDTSNPQYIETVWGAGYRFMV